MSERKTEEIKFRVTPSEKAAWQRYAEGAGLGLSALIRREVNAGVAQSRRSQKTEGSWAVGTEHEKFQVPLAVDEASGMVAIPTTGGASTSSTIATGVCRHGTSVWKFCPRCYEAGVTR